MQASSKLKKDTRKNILKTRKGLNVGEIYLLDENVYCHFK